MMSLRWRPFAAVVLVTHLQDLHKEGEPHGQVDIGFRHVLMQPLHKNRDADGDQKRERQDLQGRMTQDEFSNGAGKKRKRGKRTMQINEKKLNHRMEKAIIDMGAAMNAALIVIGDKLGLYQALLQAGPKNTDQLAERTGTAERYVREWIRVQAAGGYVMYHPEQDNYSLSAEQAAMLANEQRPALKNRRIKRRVRHNSLTQGMMGSGMAIKWL